MKKATLVYPLVACVLIFISSPGGSGKPRGASDRNVDLARFLPNHGNCVYQAGGLLRAWPPKGPRKLWQRQIGWGKTAVVEVGGRAFTAAEIDKKQWALCLDPLTGETLWHSLLIPKENRHVVKGPVTSPVVDEDRVYFIPYAIYKKDVWEIRGPIVCLQTDGAELWRVDESFWGTEASVPLVEGDVLYVAADNPAHVVLVALDKRTGELLWSVKAESDKKNELGAQASLTYQIVKGIPQVIVTTYGTREVIGVHAQTGRIMWRYPYPAKIIMGMISTPVAIGSRLFLCGGEGRGKNFSACLQMNAQEGKITFQELYLYNDRQTNNYNTVAVYQDAVFGFSGQGINGSLQCTDFPSGKLLWEKLSKDWSKDQQLIIADGLLFAVTKNEELVLAEASRVGYRELSRFPIGFDLGRPQQPTIANGRLYLRGNQIVACYQVAGKTP